MRWMPFALLLLAVPGLSLSGSTESALRQADELFATEQFASARRLLIDALDSPTAPAERAELCWRLARCLVFFAEELRESGTGPDELRALYQQGDSYGALAVELAPRSALGYYWRAANLGKLAKLRGAIEALRLAGRMKVLLVRAIEIDPAFPDSYYVLGQIYRLVPAKPFGFGNRDQAVSLGRRAEALQEVSASPTHGVTNHDFAIELTQSLYKRNWSSTKRARSQPAKEAVWRAATDPLAAALAYEGSMTLKPMSDRKEARELLTRVIVDLEGIPDKGKIFSFNLAKAREVLRLWGP